MAIRLASQCCEAIKRHAADVCGRDGLSPDYTYAVLTDDERHAAAILSLDRNSLLVRHGCAQATIRAILSADESDARPHPRTQTCSRIWWEPFETTDFTHYQGCSHAFLMETRAKVSIPLQPVPGLHVVSAPSDQIHLLIRASPDRASTEPHIVCEVGVVYARHRAVEPKEWHRCIAAVSGPSIRFDPPVTHWSHWPDVGFGFSDRTMRIRTGNGILRDLVPPGLVRIGKLDCSRFQDSCQPHGNRHEVWTVEAVERIAPTRLEDEYYAKERRAVELLSAQITVVSLRAARLIQRAWRRAVSDPAYDVCLRRLSREFDEGLPM